MSEEARTNGWVTTTVGEVATLVRGITYNKEQASKSSSPNFKPILRANNINGTLNFDDLVFVPQHLIRSEQIIKTGDIIFAMSSGSKHLVGKSARARFDFDGSYGAFCGLLRAHEHVDENFLYFVFQNNKFRRLISEVAKGSNINNLKREHILDFEIALPPLHEQHRIVAKIEELFSELDKGIENLKTARAQLKVYRQALLKHAFEGKLTAQWRAENQDKLETADALLKRIQQKRAQGTQQQLAGWEASGKRGSKPKAVVTLPSLTAEELAELPDLPEGWGWFKVAHICDVVRGGSPRPAGDPKFYGGDIPFLKVADITNTSTPYLSSFTYTITEAGLSKTRQIEPNTLLLSNSGATLGVPKICLISATMNDGVAAFLGLPHEALLYHYYFWQGKTEHLRNINQGAAQPNLNTDLIKETFIPICSQSEQLAVLQKLEAALSEADQLELTITTSLQQSEALRQSILKKAFSGQLVPQDPHDEPASALLARIRAERATVARSATVAAKPRKVAEEKA